VAAFLTPHSSVLTPVLPPPELRNFPCFFKAKSLRLRVSLPRHSARTATSDFSSCRFIVLRSCCCCCCCSSGFLFGSAVSGRQTNSIFGKGQKTHRERRREAPGTPRVLRSRELKDLDAGEFNKHLTDCLGVCSCPALPDFLICNTPGSETALGHENV